MEPDVTQQDTMHMSAFKLESGQINAYALLNDLMRKEIVVCHISIDDHVKFHVKHLNPHNDGWIECCVNKDVVIFITQRTPLTLYVKGVI